MRNVRLDNRARSLNLNPPKRNTNPSCKIIIEPARGIGRSFQTEQILNCIDWRNRVKR